MQKLKLDWFEPIDFAKRISDNYQDKNWVFLYSGLNKKVSNSISRIALFTKEEIITESFFESENKVKNDKEKWFGYLSYEVGNEFEKFEENKNSFINLAKIHLVKFKLIFEFNHDKKSIKALFDDKNLLDLALSYQEKTKKLIKNKVKNINSNFTNESYLAAICDIKKMIENGDLYQTNLTRKFFGEFQNNQNHQENFDLFYKLSTSNKANYSAFLKLDDCYIISTSPELFLKSKNNFIISRPIKGTAPRGKTKKEDERNKFSLKNNPKEKAENLMIVDLVRNDLSKICKPSSVAVKNIFKINSYKNIHHMSSEIYGKVLPEFSSFDAIKSCFPAGSMTGAPKIKAMEIAMQKEKINRGVYSGAIGYVSNREINLSVVIRTLIIKDSKFEFQVGGAITNDSNPNMELAETFSKARAIMDLLKISNKNL